jgi:hypothetical protein
MWEAWRQMSRTKAQSLAARNRGCVPEIGSRESGAIEARLRPQSK